MNLNGNDLTALTVRINNIRKNQKGETDQRAVKILQTRINHIKETVSNHLTTDFSETDVDRFLKL